MKAASSVTAHVTLDRSSHIVTDATLERCVFFMYSYIRERSVAANQSDLDRQSSKLRWAFR